MNALGSWLAWLLALAFMLMGSRYIFAPKPAAAWIRHP